MDNRDKILAILKRVAKKSAVPEDGESLFDSGFLDSFALPDVVAELEQEFGIQIPDADLNPRKFESVARITEYVESRM